MPKAEKEEFELCVPVTEKGRWRLDDLLETMAPEALFIPAEGRESDRRNTDIVFSKSKLDDFNCLHCFNAADNAHP